MIKFHFEEKGVCHGQYGSLEGCINCNLKTDEVVVLIYLHSKNYHLQDLVCEPRSALERILKRCLSE